MRGIDKSVSRDSVSCHVVSACLMALLMTFLYALIVCSPAFAQGAHQLSEEETGSAPMSLNVRTQLYGYDDIRVSWAPVACADLYRILIKRNSSDDFCEYATTNMTFVEAPDLADGVLYTFKVEPITTVSSEETISATQESQEKYCDDLSSIFTLKRVAVSFTVRTSAYAHIGWCNIKGENGYQLSRSTKSSVIDPVYSFSTSVGYKKALKASHLKTYYFRIRAYACVGGKRIYGPWSKPFRSLYVNPKVYEGRYQFPVPTFKRISSHYGRRICPFHGGEFHNGVDIQANLGEPIYAAGAGRVKKACWSGKYGYAIVIDHGNGRTTLYVHQKKHGFKVTKGQQVIAGQRIGTVGCTGASTGPHLHWSVKVGDKYRNPLLY